MTPKDPANHPPGQRRAGRRPGRPAADPAEPDQRTRLIEAALAGFVRQGIAATTLRGIAAEAGVTPALAHYYFGNKQQLVQTVIEERLLPILETLHRRLASAGEDVNALVTAFVEGFHGVVAQAPWLPALWAREILLEGGSLRPLLMDRIAPLAPRLLADRFAAAQAAGALNAQLDPRLLVVSLVGLTIFPLAAAPIWRMLFGAADIDTAALTRHTLALLAPGLAPAAEAP
ncbi:TetR/AcrR family transcriptional regulator [Immundisolibacter sp.]|uniref:TetR/AcrR family transcriptional regulator n=1 Tax=Immundisolibacter sp. TaxID=1934948 RepID=UPI0035673280